MHAARAAPLLPHRPTKNVRVDQRWLWNPNEDGMGKTIRLAIRDCSVAKSPPRKDKTKPYAALQLVQIQNAIFPVCLSSQVPTRLDTVERHLGINIRGLEVRGTLEK